MKTKFKLKDNGLKLKFIIQDHAIDEIWVRTHKQEGWTVIGYDNLLDSIAKMCIKLGQYETKH